MAGRGTLPARLNGTGGRFRLLRRLDRGSRLQSTAVFDSAKYCQQVRSLDDAARAASSQAPTSRNCPGGNDARVFRMLPTSGFR